MLARRLTGSLLTALMLHLNLLGADFACAKHGSAQGEAAHVMAMPADDEAAADESHIHAMSESASADHHATTSDEPQVQALGEHPPCDIPVQPNCCKALASCSVVFDSGDELDVASALYAHQLMATDAMHTPPSERAAPEPPPPKA